jgi:hypothetical protein
VSFGLLREGCAIDSGPAMRERSSLDDMLPEVRGNKDEMAVFLFPTRYGCINITSDLLSRSREATAGEKMKFDVEELGEEKRRQYDDVQTNAWRTEWRFPRTPLKP